MERGDDGDVYAGCTPYRWVLEHPPAFAESNAVAAPSSAEIVYAVSSTVPGTFDLDEFAWAGYYAATGEAAFGYSESTDARRLTFLETGIVSASHSSSGYRSPGSNTAVVCQIAYPTNRTLLSLLWRPTLPDGWTLRTVSGDGAPEWQDDEIVFTGILTNNPVRVAYTLDIPAGEIGPRQVFGEAEYWLNGEENPVTARAQPDPLPVLSLHELTVTSPYGTASPPTGVHLYAYGSDASCAILVSPVPGGVGTQVVCVGWTGVGSVPAAGSGTNLMFAITNDSAIAWNWKTQHWFEATSGPGGGITADHGWFDAGAGATAEAAPLSGFLFDRWAGDAPAESAGHNPISLPMDRARHIVAVFAADTNVLRGVHACAGYHSPGTGAVVTCRFDYPSGQTLASFVWHTGLPPNWTVTFAEGDGAPVVQGPRIVFAGPLTNNPLSFAYRVATPGNAATTNAIGGAAEFRFASMGEPFVVDAVPEPLWAPRYHSADYREPFWKLDGSEVNRVLAYWRSGGYRVEPAGTDGYSPTDSPDPHGTEGPRHSADFMADHWVIDLTEVNRVLAHWRAGAYRVDAEGEDGYAPVVVEGLGIASFSDSGGTSATVTVTQHAPDGYDPGGFALISNTFEFAGHLLSLGWRPRLPPGWTLTSVEGPGTPESRRGEIVWTGDLPPSPFGMTYTVSVPFWEVGVREVGGEIEHHFAGMANPLRMLAVPAPLMITPRDTDGDGLPDTWEAFYGDGHTSLAPGGDEDDDGMTNLQEYLAGTNPRDPRSALRFTDLEPMPDGTVGLRWLSATNRAYRILFTTNPAEPFLPLATNLFATPPTNSIFDAPGGASPVFYRILLE